MSRIFEDQFFSAHVFHEQRRIEMIRSSLAFPDTAAMLRTVEAFMTAIRHEGATDYKLLVDSTQAPTATGESYRKAFERFAAFLNKNFSQIAVVLCSQASAMKMSEESSHDRMDFFANVEAARRALASDLELAR